MYYRSGASHILTFFLIIRSNLSLLFVVLCECPNEATIGFHVLLLNDFLFIYLI